MLRLLRFILTMLYCLLMHQNELNLFVAFHRFAATEQLFAWTRKKKATTDILQATKEETVKYLFANEYSEQILKVVPFFIVTYLYRKFALLHRKIFLVKTGI